MADSPIQISQGEKCLKFKRDLKRRLRRRRRREEKLDPENAPKKNKYWDYSI